MLQAGVIVGGWDKYEGGQIYSVPLGGTILRQPFSIGGIVAPFLFILYLSVSQFFYIFSVFNSCACAILLRCEYVIQ